MPIVQGALSAARRAAPAPVRRVWRSLRGRRVEGGGDHRYAVGGFWEEMGAAQINFLKAEGLKPDHRLLDIGCGALRGGVKLIPYLDPGNYYGIDISEAMLEAGRHELVLAGISDRHPNLRCTDVFDMDFDGARFDYAIAQSVFTHIDLNSVLRCILNVEKVLTPAGRFYATFLENPAGKNSLDPIDHPQTDGTTAITHLDRDPFHYSVDAFEWACSGTGLKVDYLGAWGSLRGQKMLLFTRRPGALGTR